jgi:hypothetical protein
MLTTIWLLLISREQREHILRVRIPVVTVNVLEKHTTRRDKSLLQPVQYDPLVISGFSLLLQWTPQPIFIIPYSRMQIRRFAAVTVAVKVTESEVKKAANK